MQYDYLALLTIFIGILLFIIQRTEQSKRRIVIFIMIIPAVLLRNFAIYRDVEQEAWTALFIAVFLNILFWLLIGRYNPVRSSDEIKVLGLDD